MLEPKIETFIRCCIQKKDTKDLKDLLGEAVNINEFGQNGRTPLMEVCRHNAAPTIVRFLLQNGADVKKRGRGGETALILLGHSQKSSQDIDSVLCELLNHGADINESDNAFLDKVYDNSLYVADKYNFKIIECSHVGKIRSIDDISREIYDVVRTVLD